MDRGWAEDELNAINAITGGDVFEGDSDGMEIDAHQGDADLSDEEASESTSEGKTLRTRNPNIHQKSLTSNQQNLMVSISHPTQVGPAILIKSQHALSSIFRLVALGLQ